MSQFHPSSLSAKKNPNPPNDSELTLTPYEPSPFGPELESDSGSSSVASNAAFLSTDPAKVSTQLQKLPSPQARQTLFRQYVQGSGGSNEAALALVRGLTKAPSNGLSSHTHYSTTQSAHLVQRGHQSSTLVDQSQPQPQAQAVPQVSADQCNIVSYNADTHAEAWQTFKGETKAFETRSGQISMEPEVDLVIDVMPELVYLAVDNGGRIHGAIVYSAQDTKVSGLFSATYANRPCGYLKTLESRVAGMGTRFLNYCAAQSPNNLFYLEAHSQAVGFYEKFNYLERVSDEFLFQAPITRR